MNPGERSLSPRSARALASVVATCGLLTAGSAEGGTSDPATERLTIASDSSCPSGEAVVEALLGLRPAGAWPSKTVRIHAEDRFLFVDLGTGTASRRQLAVVPDCATRALMVAVVIATWMDDLPAETADAPVLRSPTPRPVPLTAERIPPPNLPSASNEREVGLGLLMAASGGIVPGLRVDFVQSRRPRGLGWQAGLALPAWRELSTAVGSIRWTRPSVYVALNARIPVGRYLLAGDGGLAGAYTFAKGQGYAIDQNAQSFTFGFVAGMRLGIPWRRFRIWADLRFYGWLTTQSIQIDSTAGERVASSSLPSWDGQLSVGLSYVFR